MRLFINELKYSTFTLLIFSAMYMLMTFTMGTSERLLPFRVNPVIFTPLICIYSFLYRKEEKSERFLVTLPVNIRLIPLLRFITPIVFWIFTQISFFAFTAFYEIKIEYLNEFIVSIKTTGLLISFLSLGFIYFDKIISLGLKDGFRKISGYLSLTLVFVLSLLYSLLPVNVINKTNLESIIFIREFLRTVWQSNISIIGISLGAVILTIIYIEQYAKKNFYLN